MNAFPKDLAKRVSERWSTMIAGDYTAPPCPPLDLLKELLEICFLSANIPDEGRLPKFNVIATPVQQPFDGVRYEKPWPFLQPRTLSIAEFRALAPATDLRKSAIWVSWNETEWKIVGIVDLGTSWHRARMGFEYAYQAPSRLFIQVDRPGRLRVYQGQFLVASLSDGALIPEKSDYHLALHSVANSGLIAMDENLIRPKREYIKEWAEFEFMALWNTFAAIANSISQSGHGGTVIILPTSFLPPTSALRVKYPHDSQNLRSALIGFLNARHKLGDLIAAQEEGKKISQQRFAFAELQARQQHDILIEQTRFVAGLAGCDGAIILSHDLRLLGFGAEILAEMREGVEVFDVIHELRKTYRALDVEQFGMRHRSAIKLVSQISEARSIVISQDGPISVVWREQERLYVKKGVSLVNMNMPLG
jgi:hypothetical protein